METSYRVMALPSGEMPTTKKNTEVVRKGQTWKMVVEWKLTDCIVGKYKEGIINNEWVF